jgi:hypothetical protein
MTRRPPRYSAWLMLGAVVVLVGCGAEGGSTSSGRDDADTTATLAPTSPVAATRLSVRDDLVDAQVVRWRSWRAVDDTTLEFTVTAGAADCYAAQPEVVESDAEVRVRLHVGRLPERADRECQAIALESVVPVRLATPLGTRRVEPLT